MDDRSTRLHGTAVAFADRAVLLRGRSGSGKSDLALRCIELPSSPLGPPAMLVADDQVLLERAGDAVLVSAPQATAGLIEVRGVGLARLPVQALARLVLIVDLVARDAVERLPLPWPTEPVLGVPLPRLALDPFEASAANKVRLAVHHLGTGETVLHN